MKKFLICFSMFFFLIKVAYAQRDWGGMSALEDDEELTTLGDVGFGLISGGIIAGIGYFLRQIKTTSSLGQILIYIGSFLAIGGVVIYLLQIIGMVLSVVLSFAFKAALVIGGIYLVLRILVGIYEWLTK